MRVMRKPLLGMLDQRARTAPYSEKRNLQRSVLNAGPINICRRRGDARAVRGCIILRALFWLSLFAWMGCSPGDPPPVARLLDSPNWSMMPHESVAPVLQVRAGDTNA